MDFLRAHVGEAAALATATCWVFSSIAFAGATRRIGPTAVNVIRMFVAFAIVLVVHRLLFGLWIPPVDSGGLAYLAISGLIGFAIGDQFFFVALVDLGPRMATVFGTLTPPVAALMAWPMLKEPLSVSSVVGMGHLGRP
jgi:drug/metabolite transporter (DMT)-like permease